MTDIVLEILIQHKTVSIIILGGICVYLFHKIRK